MTAVLSFSGSRRHEGIKRSAARFSLTRRLRVTLVNEQWLFAL